MKLDSWLMALIGLALLAMIIPTHADSLEEGFRNPPQAAQPQTWWHWMNGNVTKAGITADLEAMKAIGLGGASVVNVDCGIPAGKVTFMSAAWRDHFKFAIQEAARLGLDMTVANCAGYSSSGGPWMTPEHAMQRVTTSETPVNGPKNFDDVLPQPETKLDFYRDIAVLAFPASDEKDVGTAEPAPKVSLGTDGGAAKTVAGEMGKMPISVPAPTAGKASFIGLEFRQPLAARSVRIVGGPSMPECSGEILASDDGRTFREAGKFAFKRHGSSTVLASLGEQLVAARFWRVRFTGLGSQVTATSIPVAKIELLPQLALDDLQFKAGMWKDHGVNQEKVLSSRVVPLRQVVDLTSKVAADGRLRWSVPPGRWIIQRIGYTPTGAKNSPASVGGAGLECDKLSAAGLDAHWDGFMAKIIEDVGPLAGKVKNLAQVSLNGLCAEGNCWRNDESWFLVPHPQAQEASRPGRDQLGVGHGHWPGPIRGARA